MKKKLSPRQENFCREYLIDFNATRAYQRAGYASSSDEIARKNAAKLMTTEVIKARIQELKGDRAERVDIEGDRVLKEIARLAFSSITDVISFSDRGIVLKDSSHLDDDVKGAIAEVTIVENEKGIKKSVKMHDKNKSLALLMKYLGLDSDFNSAIACLKKYGLVLYQTDAGWQVKDENVSS
jgi:phage terminase small subunit